MANSFPCPYMSLQAGVKLIAVFDAIFTIMFLMVLSFILLLMTAGPGSGYYMGRGSIYTIVAVILTIFLAIRLFLANSLHKGACDRDYNRCRTWLTVTIIYMIIWGILFGMLIMSQGFPDGLGTGIFGLILGLISAYMMLVVYEFMEELKWAGMNVGYAGPVPPFYDNSMLPPPQSYQVSARENPTASNSKTGSVTNKPIVPGKDDLL